MSPLIQSIRVDRNKLIAEGVIKLIEQPMPGERVRQPHCGRIPGWKMTAAMSDEIKRRNHLARMQDPVAQARDRELLALAEEYIRQPDHSHGSLRRFFLSKPCKKWDLQKGLELWREKHGKTWPTK